MKAPAILDILADQNLAGSKPGSPRTVNVSLVFQLEEERRIYVSGYCPERGANRVFALDLVMVLGAWN
jgi:hypothetical protein